VLLVGCEPIDDAPILDLRIRKGVRRNGVKLAIAGARPSALDPNATQIVRCAPGGELDLLVELERALAAGGADGPGGAERAPGPEGAESQDTAALAGLLRDGGEDVVIVWSEQIGAPAAAVLLRIAERLGLSGRAGAGLLEVPAGSNGRGLREAGVIPDAGHGYGELPGGPGRAAREIARAGAAGELTALYLLQTDPVRDQPDRALWERALHRAALVVAHASVLTEGLREHATVIFPAESHAEKEGTVVHPDGRLQRLRVAIAHPGEVQPGWAVIAELARRAGTDFEVGRSEDVFDQLVQAVPFYEGLTHDAIGGQGVRWPEREQAAAASGPSAWSLVSVDDATAVTNQNGSLRVGTYRPIWAAPECEISPALHFLIPRQHVELSPDDARRLGIADGDEVLVSQNGTRLNAKAAVRSSVRAGSVFLAEGIETDSANALTEPLVEVRKA
jgi:NADH-quinone oxidoreductase subunit G